MRGFEIVFVVIAAFFFCGIGVGVLLVMALPAIRRRRGARDIGWEYEYRPDRLPSGYRDDEKPGPLEPPGSAGDDTLPRWPGGTSA